MSALAGVCDWTGTPTRRTVERLLAWQHARHPHGDAIYSSECAALGVARFDSICCVNAPADLIAETGRTAVVFDGRIDDRDTLLESAGIDQPLSDAAIVLLLYERWGLKGLARLSGEFACLLWDRPAARLVAARDLFAQRPLYYRADGTSIAFASELQALVRLAPVRVNENVVAEFLASRAVSVRETLYRGIFRVPPGLAVVVRRHAVDVVSLASLDLTSAISYAGAEEHEEHFREVLTLAVRDRLHAHGRVGVMLSGGLDSSSILAVAGAEARAGRSLPPAAYTLAFPDRPCDEHPFARDVVERLGLQSHTSGPALDYDFAGESQETLQPPSMPSAAAIAPLRSLAVRHGVRVMLTGVGADEWLAGSHWFYVDLVRRGRVLTAARRWCLERRNPEFVGILRIARAFAWDRASPWLQRNVRRAFNRRLYPSWLDRNLIRRVDLVGRERWRHPLCGGTLIQRELIAAALAPSAIDQAEEQTRFAALFGLEDRQPFFDRRVVQFALAIPETLRAQAGVTKVVERQAMANQLPESVLRRTTQMDYSFVTADAVQQLATTDAFDNMRVAARGWVRADAFASSLGEALDRYRAAGAADARALASLWPVASLELWHRAVEHHLAD